MSYRAIKRLLGESSLERKCRILFGVCLLLLFGAAFFAADRVAERLVLENTKDRAHDLVLMELVRMHFVFLSQQDGQFIDVDHDFEDIAFGLASDAGMERIPFKAFALDDIKERRDMKIASPEREDVKPINSILAQIEELMLQKGVNVDDVTPNEFFRDYLREQEEFSQAALANADESLEEANEADVAAADLGESSNGLPRIYAEARPGGTGEYHYYELYPITMQSCRFCHEPITAKPGDNALSNATNRSGTDVVSSQEEPHGLIVCKVVVPDRQSQAAINWIRAILISVAIVTVFFAMITSYVIVRYVIVKPLKHLRDVSDEISRGKTELRAEIHTGDEFEHLAASFNRMLRHLVDAQKELRSVNRDLDANVDELAQLNMRLYEMNQLRGEFLANMSHELRTPLNSIIGFSEVLEGIDSLSDKQKRYAGNIRKSGRLLLEMINDILDLAKIEAGKMEIKPSSFRIDAVIGELVDMVRTLAAEKNIDIELLADRDAPPLYQDQVKVQQILTNLLSNAIKFTPEGGRVSIRAERTHELSRGYRLSLSVADTGVGIADSDRLIIFEKFRQGTAVLGGSNLTREYSGTGLGLSIVKELCRLLGGEVAVESELGKGSMFIVNLPWECPDEPLKPSSDITSRLDELTRPKRSDFERGNWSRQHDAPKPGQDATTIDEPVDEPVDGSVSR